MHEGSLCLCKCHGEKFLRETILLLWTSFFTIISPLRLVSLRAFISFQQGVPIVGWLGLSLHLIGGERRSFSLSQGSRQGTLLKQAGIHFLPILVKQVIFVQRVYYSHPLLYFSLSYLSFSFLFFLIFTTVRQPALSKFHLDHVQRAHSFVDRAFHCLVTLRCLASWGLGPEPTEKALAHELTTRRCEFSPFFFFSFFFFSFFFYFLYLSHPNTKPFFFQEWQT